MTERRAFAWNELIEARHGAFLVNRRDKWIGDSMIEYGEWSEGEIELFAKLVGPGDVVIEVGSNAGYHTVPLARLVQPGGAVFAFEPQRIVFQTLCANLVLNGTPNVKALAFAVGAPERSGETIAVPVLDPWRRQAFGGVELAREYDERAVERVELVGLDGLGFGNVRLVKVDVEGMEPEVLLGARNLIADKHPTLYLEADREPRNDALFSSLDLLGYRSWWHFPPLFSPANFRAKEGNIFGEVRSIGVLCFHASDAARGEDLLPGRERLPDEKWTSAIARLDGLR